MIIQVLPPPYTTLLSTEKENQQNGGVSTIKIINTDALKRNACDDIIIDFNKFPLGTVALIGASSLGSISITETPMSFSTTTLVLIENSSSSSLSLQSQEESAIKLYPIPASTYIYIDQADNATLTLLNITGNWYWKPIITKIMKQFLLEI